MKSTPLCQDKTGLSDLSKIDALSLCGYLATKRRNVI